MLPQVAISGDRLVHETCCITEYVSRCFRLARVAGQPVMSESWTGDGSMILLTEVATVVKLNGSGLLRPMLMRTSYDFAS
jgi:hypothetical protein